jgi:serine/threonine-protein kinase
VLRRRVWTVGRLLVLLGALGATYVAFFVTSASVTNRAREVKVPDLRGKTVSEADAMLTREGLVLKSDPTRVPDANVPAGRILSQEPEPGRILRRARAVRVRVSDGMRAALVPAVSGQPERTAEMALTGARLPVVGRAEIRSSDYPANVVVAQDPPAGARSGGVRLLVNRPEDGPSYVAPDLMDLPYDRVVHVLRQFPVRLALQASLVRPNVPTGTIVQQYPEAGSKMRAGEPLSVWTSR